MVQSENKELEQIVGGGCSVWVGIAIAAVIVFLSGVIEGFTNPGRCSE